MGIVLLIAASIIAHVTVKALVSDVNRHPAVALPPRRLYYQGLSLILAALLLRVAAVEFRMSALVSGTSMPLTVVGISVLMWTCLAIAGFCLALLMVTKRSYQ